MCVKPTTGLFKNFFVFLFEFVECWTGSCKFKVVVAVVLGCYLEVKGLGFFWFCLLRCVFADCYIWIVLIVLLLLLVGRRVGVFGSLELWSFFVGNMGIYIFVWELRGFWILIERGLIWERFIYYTTIYWKILNVVVWLRRTIILKDFKVLRLLQIYQIRILWRRSICLLCCIRIFIILRWWRWWIAPLKVRIPTRTFIIYRRLLLFFCYNWRIKQLSILLINQRLSLFFLMLLLFRSKCRQLICLWFMNNIIIVSRCLD